MIGLTRSAASLAGVGIAVCLVQSQALPTIPPANSKAPRYGYTVVGSFPHDPKAFTQGLEYRDGFLYEGTGLRGRSSIRKVDLATGKVLLEEKLHPQYFGEGITVTAGKVFQVTWQDHVGFVYDAKTFRPIRNFSYFGDGWGLTHDAFGLILSNGRGELKFLEMTRFQEKRRFWVRDANVAIANVNELEWVRGEIWANVWSTDYIARISPADGRVLGWINLQGLVSAGFKKSQPEAVLNGIAYDAQHDRLFVTGKLWPKVFEIRIR